MNGENNKMKTEERHRPTYENFEKEKRNGRAY
jgi:hypothetical protein